MKIRWYELLGRETAVDPWEYIRSFESKGEAWAFAQRVINKHGIMKTFKQYRVRSYYHITVDRKENTSEN